MRTLFLFFSIFTALSLSAQELPDDVMPLSEVRAGMSGYMLSTVSGLESQRLPIRVVGIDSTNAYLPGEGADVPPELGDHRTGDTYH